MSKKRKLLIVIIILVVMVATATLVIVIHNNLSKGESIATSEETNKIDTEKMDEAEEINNLENDEQTDLDEENVDNEFQVSDDTQEETYENEITIEYFDKDDTEEHYSAIVTVNGVKYYQFDQSGSNSYYGSVSTSSGDTQIRTDSTTSTLASMGCGVYSVTSLLSAYTDTIMTPLEATQYISLNYGTDAFNGGGYERVTPMNQFLNDNGVSGRWYGDAETNNGTDGYDGTTDWQEVVKTAISEGKPAIIYILPNETAPWFSEIGHYFVIVGIDGDTVYTVDSVSSKNDEDRLVTTWETLTNSIDGVVHWVWIPDEAPVASE